MPLLLRLAQLNCRVEQFRCYALAAAHALHSHIEMGLHYGCSLVAASLKGLQSASLYQVVQPQEHYARRAQSCVGSTAPPPPSEEACLQPVNSLTAPLFAEVAEWTSNVSAMRH